MSELKPCPFCGGTAGFIETEGWRGSVFYAKCEDCCAEIDCSGTAAGATKAWNTRVPDATLSAEVERLTLVKTQMHAAAMEAIARAEAAEARVAVLTYERDKARRYCSVAAYDMAGFAETLKEKPEAFPRTTHDLMETSEFMALAAEGREDGTVYDDELSKEKARVAVLEEALSNVLPPSRGIHGGPLIQMVATYEDGTDEDSARHKGRISPEAISRARAALSHTKEEVND